MSKCKMFFLGGVAATASILYFAQAVDNSAQACSSAPYLGSVCYFAGNYCPQGFVIANGAILPVSGNEALFSLYSSTYGGDGRTNFAVPDLRGRAAIGDGSGPGLTPRVLGQVVGLEAVTLNSSTMPGHSHTATFTGTPTAVSVGVTQPVNTAPGTSAVPATATPYLGAASGSPSAAKKLWAATAGTAPVAVGGVDVTVSALPALSGGASVTNTAYGSLNPLPVPIYGPQMAVMPCIATEGLYPSRN